MGLRLGGQALHAGLATLACLAWFAPPNLEGDLRRKLSTLFDGRATVVSQTPDFDLEVAGSVGDAITLRPMDELQLTLRLADARADSMPLFLAATPMRDTSIGPGRSAVIVVPDEGQIMRHGASLRLAATIRDALPIRSGQWQISVVGGTPRECFFAHDECPYRRFLLTIEDP